jgi:hypothetical protein
MMDMLHVGHMVVWMPTYAVLDGRHMTSWLCLLDVLMYQL